MKQLTIRNIADDEEEEFDCKKCCSLDTFKTLFEKI